MPEIEPGPSSRGRAPRRSRRVAARRRTHVTECSSSSPSPPPRKRGKAVKKKPHITQKKKPDKIHTEKVPKDEDQLKVTKQ